MLAKKVKNIFKETPFCYLYPYSQTFPSDHLQYLPDNPGASTSGRSGEGVSVEKDFYSLLNELTGLAVAAFIAW